MLTRCSLFGNVSLFLVILLQLLLSLLTACYKLDETFKISGKKDVHLLYVSNNVLSIVRTKRQLLKFSILDLTVNNIFRAYDDVQSKKNHEELIIHFQNIENLLTQQKEELKSINEEIKLLRMTVGYAQHEENIKDGLFVLNEYLGQPDDMYSRNSFFEEARKLPMSISALMDGLLGENAFNADILARMRDIVEVSYLHLSTFVCLMDIYKVYVSSVTAGIWKRKLNRWRGWSWQEFKCTLCFKR